MTASAPVREPDLAARTAAAERDAVHWRESSDDYRRLLAVEESRHLSAKTALAAAEARAAELELLLHFAEGFIGAVIRHRDTRFIDFIASMPDLTRWWHDALDALAPKEGDVRAAEKAGKERDRG